ncbi:MAG TPA: TolC family protein [candidate division Zixibacteria bacterium]|nr:TolC family protein [candidate division Zixibacteria bacterium]
MNKRTDLLTALAAVCLISTGTGAPLRAESLSLTVDEAVERALTHNPSLRISQATLDEMNSLAWQATTTRLPRLDFSAGVQRFDPNLFGSESFVTIDEQRQAELRASHTIISGGSVHGQAKVARSLAQAAKHDHRAQRLLTIQTVRQAFFDALLAHQLLAVAEEAVSTNQEEVRRTNVQFEIGEAARINVLRAEVQLANSIPVALRARQNVRITKNYLANLLALELDPGDLELESLRLNGSLETSRRLTLPDLARLISAAQENSPALRSSHAQINVARGQAQSTWSAVLPRVDAYGAYKWQGADGSSIVGGNFTTDNKGWEIGATASMPLFDFFGNFKGVQAGRAKIRRAEIAEEDLRRQVELDVRTAYSAYLESAEAVKSQDKNVERARESLRLARQSQSAGEATQLDVQQAQLDLTQAQSLSAQANRDLLLAETALLASIGLETMVEAARYGIAVSD